MLQYAAERYRCGGTALPMSTVILCVVGRSHGLTAASCNPTAGRSCRRPQDPDVVGAALGHFRRKPSLGFSDCLVLEIARKSGQLPLGTFDRNLGRLDGAQRL